MRGNVWRIDRHPEQKDPSGPAWKLWTASVVQAFATLGILIDRSCQRSHREAYQSNVKRDVLVAEFPSILNGGNAGCNYESC